MTIENGNRESAPDIDSNQDSKPQKKIKITASNGWNLVARPSVSNSVPATRPRPVGKAKLSGLPSLPLDIHFEIFSHLDPLDLLHLARTTKPFRRVLMSRSAISVWKDARSNVVGMPECPPSTSEPAYANLAFDFHCHNCLTTNVRNVEWRLGVRYCVKCSKICLLPIDDFKEKNIVVSRCLPFAKWPGLKGRDTKYCTIKAKDALLQEFKKLDSKKGTRSSFIKQKQIERDVIIAHAKKCQGWADRVQAMRSDELDDLRCRRKEDIENRLSQLGWDYELDWMPRCHSRYTYGLVLFHEHALVRQPKLLTDRSWNNIKSEMIEFMEGMKAFRLGRERVATLQRRRQSASTVLRDFKQTHRPIVDTPELIMPGAADFWEWQPVSALINRPRSEPDVTLKQFQNISDIIHAFFDSWRRESAMDIMMKLDIKDLPYAGEYLLRLQQMRLAVSVFTCQKGLCHNDPYEAEKPHQYMYYPEYLHHRCNRIRRIDWGDPDDASPPLSLGNGYRSGIVRQPWSCEDLEYDEKASRVVKKILLACGWNWKTMTVKELDKLDPRLVCLKCTYGHRCDGERRVSVRSWRNAVVHCMQTHWGSNAIEWEKVSDADAEKARNLAVKAKNGHAEPAVAEWRCAHCQDIPLEPEKMTLAALHSHLGDSHNVHEERLEGKDYTRAMDVAPYRLHAIDMVPQPTM